MLLLFGRRQNWVRNKYTLYAVFLLFAIGLTFLLIYRFNDVDKALEFWALMSPALILLIDYGFAMLSFSIHGRDYYLWLKGSSDLNVMKFAATDRIFSILMLYITLAMPFLILVLVKIFK